MRKSETEDKVIQSDDPLRNIFLFKGLPSAEYERVKQLVQPLRYREQWTLFREGEAAKHLYLIRSGSVKLMRHHEDREMMVAILFAGDSFGELSLIDGKPRSATAITLETCEFLVINRTPFLELLARQPQLSHQIMVQLCMRLRSNLDRIDELQYLDASSRMYKNIRDLASNHGHVVDGKLSLNLHMSVAEIGKLAGLSQKMAEMTLTQMERRGLIEIKDQTVTLLS